MTVAVIAAVVNAQPAATSKQTSGASVGNSDALLNLRLNALSQIETGDRDIHPGSDLSRYAISPAVWATVTHLPASAATNPFTARAAASIILCQRIRHFTEQHGPPTEAQVYLLWYRPAHSMHPSKTEQNKADRFANLVHQ